MRVLFYSLVISLIYIGSLWADDTRSIAVLELRPLGISENSARIITSRLRSELFNTGKFVVVEREKMDAIFSEQGLQLSGSVADADIIRAGKLLSVNEVVAGDIGKIGDIITLSVRIINVQTGRIIRTATEDCSCSIDEVLTGSVAKIAEMLIPKNVKTPLPKSEKPILITRNENTGERKNIGAANHFNDPWPDRQAYAAEHKSSFFSGMKSMLLPGWGQLGIRQNRGYYYMAFDVLTLSAAYYYNRQKDNYLLSIDNHPQDWQERPHKKELARSAERTALGLLGVAVLNRLISAIDAGFSTSTYNEGLAVKYHLNVKTVNISREDRAAMLSLSVSF